MKNLNFVFKYFVLLLFLAAFVSSCMKSSDPSSGNTAETEGGSNQIVEGKDEKREYCLRFNCDQDILRYR